MYLSRKWSSQVEVERVAEPGMVGGVGVLQLVVVVDGW